MKWMVRAAALLASLLLLLTAAHALAGYKQPAQEGLAELDARLISPWETEKIAKLPELTVVTPAPEDPPERTALPSAPSPREEEPSRPAAVPESRSPEGPVFPEAEDWQLLLVNPWNEMPEDYEVTLKALPDGQKVDERAYDDLNAMLEACRDAGLRPKICSSYRTQAKQTYLYNNKITRLRNAGYSKAAALEVAGRWVARPGTSEHQLGLAVDVEGDTYDVFLWLQENSWKYGFIFRYPGSKTDITGTVEEVWHYRYVGKEAAAEMYEQGLCLEEYLGSGEVLP